MEMLPLRKHMTQELGVSEFNLNLLIIRAPHSYKIYSIPKKSGGARIIAQPAKETKYIQRWLMKNVFCKLPVHDCASAYKSGASIKLNASRHAGGNYISKFDFKDFFTSIKESHLELHFRKYIGNHLTNDEIRDIVRISCIKFKGHESMCLSIGAPSSPVLSNSIMFDFDQLISEWCLQNDVVYTRYADDLTFSTTIKGRSCEVEGVIKNIVRHLDYPAVRLNKQKTTHLSKKHKRRVTGIIINNEGKLSLGRQRKRMISSLVHKYTIDLLDNEKLSQLQGLLGFAKDVEPLFVARLRGKYGSKVIEEILKRRNPLP